MVVAIISVIALLANAGTYRIAADMVDMAKAAQEWAAQRSVTLTVTDTVGVLNEIAGIALQPQHFFSSLI